MKRSIALFILFIVIGGKLYSQDSGFPKNERRPYFNKFAYILDDDADNYFLAKAYKLIKKQNDNALDFMLFNLEKSDVYDMPIPNNVKYDTEPCLVLHPDSDYEYIIKWKNENKSYNLNISNKYKENFHLIFKGLTLSIKEENNSYSLIKDVTVKTRMYNYMHYVEYRVNKDTTDYEAPPMIKDNKDKLWNKLDSAYVCPYIESHINYTSKKNTKYNYSIQIRDYFKSGNIGIPTEQSLNIVGNQANAKQFLKKHCIKIRESVESRKQLDMPSMYFNEDFEKIPNVPRKIFDRHGLGLPPKRKQIEIEE